tara:strand:+ start:64 stop:570 length:507 start_codon:yes stop_codon:yes gene_type:complete
MITLNKYQKKFIKQWENPFLFSLYFLFNVPMGWFSGMKIKEISEKECITFLPFKGYYRWQNKNPFKSMYFAVQSMGAELSTATLATLATKGYSKSIALIVTEMNSKYFKKATGDLTFKCSEGEKIFEAVNEAIKTKKGVEAKVKTIGKMKDGTVVSEFYFTWSFKIRD